MSLCSSMTQSGPHCRRLHQRHQLCVLVSSFFKGFSFKQHWSHSSTLKVSFFFYFGVNTTLILSYKRPFYVSIILLVYILYSQVVFNEYLGGQSISRFRRLIFWLLNSGEKIRKPINLKGPLGALITAYHLNFTTFSWRVNQISSKVENNYFSERGLKLKRYRFSQPNCCLFLPVIHCDTL